MQPVECEGGVLIFFMNAIGLVLPATSVIGINLLREGEFFSRIAPIIHGLVRGGRVSSAVFSSSAFYNRLKKLPASNREEQVQLPARLWGER